MNQSFQRSFKVQTLLETQQTNSVFKADTTTTTIGYGDIHVKAVLKRPLEKEINSIEKKKINWSSWKVFYMILSVQLCSVGKPFSA